MKFFSQTDQSVHIALTTGHTAVVSPEGSELDKIFHKEAIARGCLPAGVEADKPAEKTSFDRKGIIENTLQSMVDGSDEKDFKADGTPNLKQVSAKAGFTVDRTEVEAIWAELTAK